MAEIKQIFDGDRSDKAHAERRQHISSESEDCPRILLIRHEVGEPKSPQAHPVLLEDGKLVAETYGRVSVPVEVGLDCMPIARLKLMVCDDATLLSAVEAYNHLKFSGITHIRHDGERLIELQKFKEIVNAKKNPWENT
ncbi:MAG TPA: hypothetical protein VG826_29500 [Pirellulales bacterium]|nr:hypothetical protein [Pirellulales bacterium]